MKIAFDAKRIFFNETGLGNYGRNVIDGLSQYYPENQYDLYTPLPVKKQHFNRFQEYSKYNIVTPQNWYYQKMPSVWRSLGIKKQLHNSRPDIYHGLSLELPYGIEKLGILSIITIHDLIFLKYPHLYKPWDAYVYQKKCIQGAHASNRIITISESTRKDIIELYQIPGSKIDVVYPAASPLYYKLPSAQEMEIVIKGYNIDFPYILSVGSFHERKNLLKPLEALAELKNSEIKLIFVGRGERYKRVMVDKIKALKLEKRVLFIENVPMENLPALYHHALASVYPSIYEGFGIPVIESMFCRTPVILSDRSSLKEAGGEGGIFVDVLSSESIAGAIDHCFDNPEFRLQKSLQGYAHVQKFHIKNCTDNLMKVYTTLLSEK